VQSWDTAYKASDLNDFSVCTTWGVRNSRYYLLDVFRRRLNYPDLKRAVRDHASLWDAMIVLIEDKASGTQSIQDLQRDGVCMIKSYEPLAGTDKIMRLHAQSVAFENGLVLLPHQAPWLAVYFRADRVSRNQVDDQVDSTTQALDHLRESFSLDVWFRFAGILKA